jgi:hypothetical protein
VRWSTRHDWRSRPLLKAPSPRAFLRTLAWALGFSIAVLLISPPLLAQAQLVYAVTSAQDFPKLPASRTECKSTQVPNNPCTLRSAIETANTAASGATINVPGAFMITLDPALGELSPTAAMSITSVGGGAAIVDGALQTRVFHVMSGATGVTMSGLTVRHGKVTVGSDHAAAGIWNEGSLTLDNVVVTLNEGRNAAGIGDEGTLIMNGGTISGNAAVRAVNGQLAAVGGLAVKAGGVAVVKNTSIVNNRAELAGGIGVQGRATLVNVTLRDNTATLGGGGLVTASTDSQPTAPDVTITNSNISGNTTGGMGGGMLLASGRVALTGSTVSGNNAPAGSGGGMFIVGSSVTLINDTLSGNVAGQGGGGIAQSTVLPRAGTQGRAPATLAAEAELAWDQLLGSSLLTTAGPARRGAVGTKAGSDDISLRSVTVAGNSAQTGGGILNAAGLAFTARDTIVAGNSGSVGANCSGSVTSGGYNLESGSDCGFMATGDRPNATSKLGGLTNNGGPTETMALQTGSAAIDAGSPDCPPPASDQRGIKRPQGAACDIGAFESTSPPIPAPPSTGHPAGRRDEQLSFAGISPAA